MKVMLGFLVLDVIRYGHNDSYFILFYLYVFLNKILQTIIFTTYILFSVGI